MLLLVVLLLTLESHGLMSLLALLFILLHRLVPATDLRHLTRACTSKQHLAAGARRPNHHHMIRLALVLRRHNFIDVEG